MPSSRSSRDPLLTLVRRYARTHGPFPTAMINARFAFDLTPALRELERGGDLVRGELLPGGGEREWCDADVLRRVRRASSPRCARRPRRSTRPSSPASSRHGRTSTPTAPPAPAPIACARRSSRCRGSR